MVFFSAWAVASEVDTFTDQCDPLPDLSDHLSAKVTEGLIQACKTANRRSRLHYFKTNYPFPPEQGVDYCNQAILYKEIRGQFARALVGQLESYVNELPGDQARTIDFDHSIYRDFTVEETPTLAGLKKMGAVVRLKDNLVGAEKFGHFFSEGWSYYIRAYAHEKDLKKALVFGLMSESIYFGALTTGVFSFSDLIANFNGMRFWNRILAEEEDPLDPEETLSPYICCENNRWTVKIPFSWEDYVDPAWDERYNRSLFRNEVLLEKVRQRIDAMGDSAMSDCPCTSPASRKTKIENMQSKYKTFSPELLNLEGHQVIPLSLSPGYLVDRYWHLNKKRANTKREKTIIQYIREYREKMRPVGAMGEEE